MRVDKHKLAADLERWEKNARVVPFTRPERASSPCAKKARRRPSMPSWAFLVVGLTVVGGAMAFPLVKNAQRFGSYDLAFRHWAAAPNCHAARMAGLAPAQRGEPGYYQRHDRDEDGIACEPWPR